MKRPCRTGTLICGTKSRDQCLGLLRVFGAKCGGHSACAIDQSFGFGGNVTLLQLRQVGDIRRGVPLSASLHVWLVEKSATLSKKSRQGKAFAYALNQWGALCYYCDDDLAECA